MRVMSASRSGVAPADGLLARGVARVLHHGAWKFRHYECAWGFVRKELASTVRTPLRVRPGLWRDGFLSESWVLYDLAHNDRRQYLSDYARFTRTRLVNGAYAAVLDNKLIFDRFVGRASAAMPPMLGILQGGKLIDPLGAAPERPAAPCVLDALNETGALVLKPLTGGGGHGISVLRQTDRGITINAAAASEDEVRRLAEESRNTMACDFVTQHPAIARLYPRTTNTLRLLTMQDDACEPFVAAAVLRIGTDRSGAADNWSRGGLSASVDVATGRVGRAVAYPAGADRMAWHLSHPDSGAAIEGIEIPNWEQVRDGVLDIFRALPVLRYVGWDVVVTEDGFSILEGNNYSDVNLLQVHGPLLADQRVTAFYRRNGVL